MKSILVGNGINIQFGGKAYTSNFIIKRIKYKALLGKYDELFDNIITGKEIVDIFEGFVNVANDILEGKYNYYADKELKNAILDFKSRYTKVNFSHEIMLEDWFLILHIYLLENKDISFKDAKQGFNQLILDAIYNESKIQNIYSNMSKEVKKFFKSFDNIFTLNYDNNLEKLTKKKVYHLHGDFSVLANGENTKNVLGYIREENNNRAIKSGMEHCFCNALLDYSGYRKMRQADANHLCILDSEKYKDRYNFDNDFKEGLLNLKNEQKELYDAIMTKINHQELKMGTEYYFDEFRNIEDELYVIGMSPNNDAHIFECINKNHKLKKIHFYCYSKKEKDFIEKNFNGKLYDAKYVDKLWKSLKCVNKKYNSEYIFPTNIEQFIEIFNEFSLDKVSQKEILDEAKNIPKYEAIRLCKLVKQDLKERNPLNKSTSKHEFETTQVSISHIALTEGVSPSTLYMLFVIHCNEIN
ncbi:hypothetical protein QTI99_06505 [Clostridium perfringens]|uniref:hypothetical protein n=1 Tax=Clostridium perfringens TaxID=1502 RepID=UPI0029134260|nr:hypothetical protein [Clostridium perfringens]EJT6170772.1 hypothetical protein [Clostridium perfringens]EJT6541497.1 hypothetical protein [Clostridium perfringens]EJT6566504.1 hypothetical protein [Clostridium perfringens]MBS5994761.1 hypothetical protein [Clostridium perfringens]MDM0997112.1 hypothetical protein [Clostridium perfringens]